MTSRNFESKMAEINVEISNLEKLKVEVRKMVLLEVCKVSEKIKAKEKERLLVEAEWRDFLLSEVRKCEDKLNEKEIY